MRADGPDGLEFSAQFDATACLSEETPASVTSTRTLVCGTTRPLGRIPHIDHRDEEECARLVAAQHRSGKACPDPVPQYRRASFHSAQAWQEHVSRGVARSAGLLGFAEAAQAPPTGILDFQDA